jgi:multicomponent Na+:H+ antiporter subunit D
VTAWLMAVPLAVPAAAAAACLLVGRSMRMQAAITFAAAVCQLAAGVALTAEARAFGPAALAVGGWPEGAAIALVADMASAVMVVLVGTVAVLAVPFAASTIDRRREAFGFYPLVNVLLLGVAGMVLTGDLFNLYVWVEVTLIASFVLMALGGGRLQMEGATKYVALNVVASALFLTGVGVVYATMGTVSLGDLARAAHESGLAWPSESGTMLVLAALLVKAAAFPFFAWLPASYHTPPIGVTALFAGLLTKAGVFALLRVSGLLLSGGESRDTAQAVLLTLGGVTMVAGVLGAAAHTDMRRILSFHIVSQCGYMVMGAGFFSSAGYAATLFFLGHNMAAKTGLFTAAGIAYRLAGAYDIRALGGLMRRHPALAASFAVCAASLAGFPPLAGFFGKLALVQAGFTGGHFAVAGVALFTSILTLYSMTKIWHEAFWKPPPSVSTAQGRAPWPAWTALFGFAALSVTAGLAAGALFEFATLAGEALADPAAFIQLTGSAEP